MEFAQRILDDCRRNVFRKGKQGDKGASGYVTVPKRPPDFVLEYEGVQIGAAHGGESRITQIEIFTQRNIGHA